MSTRHVSGRASNNRSGLIRSGGLAFVAVLSFFLLHAEPAQASTCTSVQSGDWSAQTTWGSAGTGCVGATGGIPGNGDTANIGAYAITVRDSRIVGASLAAGNDAIIKSGAGKIVVVSGGLLKVRGDYTVTGSIVFSLALDVQAGGEFRFDSTQAADPANTHYALGPKVNSWYRNTGISCVGTAQSPAYITAEASGGYGIISDRGTGSTYGGGWTANYCRVTHMGGTTKTEPAGFVYWDYSETTNIKYDVQNTIFDDTGPVNANGGESGGTSIGDNGTFRLQNVVFKNSRGPYNIYLRGANSLGSGTRLIDHSVLDKGLAVNDPGESAELYAFTITDSYLGDLRPGMPVSVSSYWTSFARNLWIFPENAATGGSVQDSIILVRSEAGGHIGEQVKAGATSAISGNVVDGDDFPSFLDESDLFPVVNNPSSATVYNISNNVVVQGASTSTVSSEWISRRGANPSTINFSHNTSFVPVRGEMFEIVNPVQGAAHTLEYFRSNIGWALSGATLPMMFRDLNFTTTTGNLQDWPDPAGVTNNVRWNIAGSDPTYNLPNSGNGYISWMSSTPGATDLAVDPQFVDTKRGTYTFYSNYLVANSLASAPASWNSESAGTTFATGTIVSWQDSSYFQGEAVALRAIIAHNKGDTGTNPFSTGNSWRSYWEPATLGWIRSQLEKNALGQTYKLTDSGISNCASGCEPEEAVRNWIRDGFAPQNPALKTAAHDGTTIGAVAWVDAYPTTVSMTAPSSGNVSGTAVSISAGATDGSGIAGVQFKLDGNNVGSEVTATSSPNTYSYSWNTVTNGGGDGSHSVTAVARDVYGNYTTSTAVMVTVSNAPAASAVSISGTPALGQTLTGSYTFTDPNLYPDSGSTYQWLESATSGGVYTGISGATSTTFAPVSTDAGKYLKFQVTPHSAGGTGSAVQSAATTQINSSGVPTATAVAISGTATEGLTLTGTYTYAQADGLPEGTSTFRWLKSSTSGGSYVAIPGATALSYALAPADVGKYLKFEVTPVATVPPATGSPVQTASVGPVAASSLPVASAVTTSGTESVGNILTASYTYTDSGSHPQGASTFRWLRSSTTNGTYAAITGATATTYTLASADIGQYLKFEVTPVSTVATGAAVQSNPSGQINSSGVPTASSVAVSGTALVGSTLTGTYTYAQADNVAEGVSAFRWLRSGTSSGTFNAISGATATTYALTSSDIGQYLKFEVTPVASVPPTNGSVVQSAATAQVQGGGGGVNPASLMAPAVPEGGFRLVINNGAPSTAISSVTLSLSGGATAARMALSNNGGFDGAGQEPFQVSKAWNLCWANATQTPSDCTGGAKTVYAKFFTAYGQPSPVVSASITYAQTEAGGPSIFPSGTLVLDRGTIYLIGGHSKTGFANMAAFKGLGYSLKNVVVGITTDYTSTALVLWSPQQAHPIGAWVLVGRTVYYVSAEGIIGVPSWSVLLANGGQTKFIVKANPSDLKALQSSPPAAALSPNDPRVLR